MNLPGYDAWKTRSPDDDRPDDDWCGPDDEPEPEDGGVTRELTHEERMFLSRVEGLFVGMLDDVEAREFQRLVEAGVAMRSYEGAGGLMGLAKVRRMVA